jgi:hypothetical protein
MTQLAFHARFGKAPGILKGPILPAARALARFNLPRRSETGIMRTKILALLQAIPPWRLGN